jgi:hypothetical protein
VIMNRRIRFRTYGGVRGRGPKGPLLLDSILKTIFQSRGFDADQISHIQVEGVYTEII